jgi:cytoskeletal protein CcmA (bactofilin family)
MSIASNERELGSATTAAEAAADVFETNSPFDRWLHDLQGGRQPLASQSLAACEEENSGIYIGSFPGSNCEVEFEGVLHFDGYSIGNISSPDGTLVLTKRGRIEADIKVGTAIINGWVTGNITATEQVVLESEARVTGQIRTRALSVRLGAVFDGDCLFTTSANPVELEPSRGERESSEREYLALAAGA